MDILDGYVSVDMLTDLKPDTEYNLVVAMKKLNGAENKSDPIVVTTTTDAVAEPKLEKSSGLEPGSFQLKEMSTADGAGNGSGGSSGSGENLDTDGVFINVGYNMFGFTGSRHAYYEIGTGWLEDADKEVRASDIAMAICDRYGLVWDDRDDPDWIGNWIKYIRSYDEDAKKFRLYTVITPETNDANFDLLTIDEDGNTHARGISLLLLDKLETIDNVDGATISFKEGS